METSSKLLMAYNGSHRSFGTCTSNGWWRIHVRRRSWHSSTLDLLERLAQPGLSFQHFFLLLTVTSSSAEVDSESVREVGTTRLSFQHVFHSAYGHKLFSESRLEGSKCNPNFQGLVSSTLFLLLMVTSFLAQVGLRAQNVTQISRA